MKYYDKDGKEFNIFADQKPVYVLVESSKNIEVGYYYLCEKWGLTGPYSKLEDIMEAY